MSGLNLKIFILIIVLLVLSGGVGFLAYTLYTTQLPMLNLNLELVNQQVNMPISINENINQNWLSRYTGDDKLIKQAILEKDTKYCDQTVEITKDDCLYTVAISLGVEVCQLIGDEQIKKKCLQYFDYIKFIEENDLNGCLALTEQEFRTPCLFQLFVRQNDLAYCADLTGEDKNLCEDLINKNIAINNTDINACDKIQSGDIKSDCDNVVKNLPLDQDNDGITDDIEKLYGLDPFKADTDGDSLNDYDELYKYKTNPTKYDTDGDGYNDGEEVNSGHNPLGE